MSRLNFLFIYLFFVIRNFRYLWKCIHMIYNIFFGETQVKKRSVRGGFDKWKNFLNKSVYFKRKLFRKQLRFPSLFNSFFVNADSVSMLIFVFFYTRCIRAKICAALKRIIFKTKITFWLIRKCQVSTRR